MECFYHTDLDGKCALDGIRRDGTSGCELTWEYFCGETFPPLFVRMIGVYDIWDFSKYGNDLNLLQTGIRLYDHRPESTNWPIWFTERF